MGLFARWKNSIRKDPLDQDAADELAWHIDQRVQEYVRAGMPLADAQLAAKKRLGNLTALTEDTVEADTVVWIDSFQRDLRLAIRMLRRAPTVTIAAVLSLALGIGANTVVFTLMKQVVLDYLPVPAPEQLVILHSEQPEEGHTSVNGLKSSFSYPLYQDLNAATGRIFQGVMAFYGVDVSLTGREETSTVHGHLVSGNFFPVMNVAPWRGRLINPADDRSPGSNPVVVLGFSLWQRMFGSDPGIVNRTVLLNKHPYVVIGIAPPQFYGIDVSNRSDLFIPMSMKADVVPIERPLGDRLDHWCRLMARLQPGFTAEQASLALRAIYPPLRDQDFAYMKTPSEKFKRAFAKKQIELTAGGQGYAEIRESFTKPLQILMAMVAVVLLITVVNVANLLVARGVARQREMAIRLSVGAGKAALARQLLMESLVLAGMGGALGIAVAYAGTPALLHSVGFSLSESSISAHPDWHVMLAAVAVTMATGLLFGLLPIWQSTRTDVTAALKATGAFGHTGNSPWLRHALVVGQVALSLVLVTAAILFTRSLRALQTIDVGFDTTRLIKFEVNPLQAGYSQPRIKSFGEELRHKLEALPGVEHVGLATVALLQQQDRGSDVTVDGAPPFSSADDAEVLRNQVSPDYFATMRIPVLAGRVFNASDTLPKSNLAVVNQSFVNHFLPGRNAIGARFHYGTGNSAMDHTIVGVVADSKHVDIRTAAGPFLYEPYLAADFLSQLPIYVRVSGNEKTLLPAIRGLVHQMDAGLPVNALTTMTETIDESLFVERSLGYLSIGFAGLATLLAIVGLYGVMSYSVTSRQRELGIRMAIGATPERVLRAVLREAAYLGIAGVVCGLPFLIVGGRYVQSALYGVEPNDPLVWSGAMLVLVAVALAAGFVPAWRAARIDPQAALRAE